MPAATIMIQGTASSVGKSLIATALCRLYQRRGLRVAPFKAQNMALNSAVTWEGHEIGRAQAAQAEACRLRPSSLMNPVLLKPEGERRSQVIVRGQSWGSMQALDYHRIKPTLRGVILESLRELRESYDLVVIEGAGSPAEINLKQHDIVNMFVATSVAAPVLLVGDIDRGGVFAAFVGTMHLLEPHERALVGGFLINKFRGDPALLKSGLDFIHKETGVPVMGVIPYKRDHRLAEEDSLSLEQVPKNWRGTLAEGRPKVAVVCLPRISNFDEFAPLLRCPGLDVIFTGEPDRLGQADLVIVPGSKNTLEDLDWLRKSGCADALIKRHAAGKGTGLEAGLNRPRWLLGVCGGCQMLGHLIDDSAGVETDGRTDRGLGLLSIRTVFTPQKRTVQTAVHRNQDASHPGNWFLKAVGPLPLCGYEIHAGKTFPVDAEGDVDHHGHKAHPYGFFRLETLSPSAVERELDGVVSACGQVVGTMVHGLFENPSAVQALAEWLGVKPEATLTPEGDLYDELADHLAEHLDINQLDQLIFGKQVVQDHTDFRSATYQNREDCR